MSALTVELGGPDTDQAVDDQIATCLDPAQPRSFFLYAGAGSGKTRSLKSALDTFRSAHGPAFRRAGKRIAVITFTNAAADEIADRVGQDPLFPISTIHSFCWNQIHTFHADIQAWLLGHLPGELTKLMERQAKGRAGTKAALDRERGIAAIQRRLDWLGEPRRFVYSPNGNNFGADSLSHAEVIEITAAFIMDKPSMQAVMVSQYPFLLIDESQDTSKILLEALFALAKAHAGRFALGLFGDTMQRIYADGQPNLGRDIPPDWAQPKKRMNHRSTQRVVELGNTLRADADGQRQLARDDSKVGLVRLFVAADSEPNKPGVETRIRQRMAQLCQDPFWAEEAQVKTLTLEHHMAASRRGFLPMFQALDRDSRLTTGLRTGELAGLRLFTQRVMPLLAACSAGDKFATMSLLRATSPLLSPVALALAKEREDPLGQARSAVQALTALVAADPSASFLAVLQCVASHGLFDIPASLRPFVTADAEPAGTQTQSEAEEGDDDVSPSSLQAWRHFLETPYAQIHPFAEYIADQGPYATHQGVKGLQFDRVLVIIDDSEARGFLFSYEKLFGAKPLSDGDHQKAAEGAETGVDRTRRLLYVTCTRAKKSLALVAYTSLPSELKQAVVARGWFGADEVEEV